LQGNPRYQGDREEKEKATKAVMAMKTPFFSVMASPLAKNLSEQHPIHQFLFIIGKARGKNDIAEQKIQLDALSRPLNPRVEALNC